MYFVHDFRSLSWKVDKVSETSYCEEIYSTSRNRVLKTGTLFVPKREILRFFYKILTLKTVIKGSFGKTKTTIKHIDWQNWLWLRRTRFPRLRLPFRRNPRTGGSPTVRLLRFSRESRWDTNHGQPWSEESTPVAHTPTLNLLVKEKNQDWGSLISNPGRLWVTTDSIYLGRLSGLVLFVKCRTLPRFKGRILYKK